MVDGLLPHYYVNPSQPVFLVQPTAPVISSMNLLPIPSVQGRQRFNTSPQTPDLLRSIFYHIVSGHFQSQSPSLVTNTNKLFCCRGTLDTNVRTAVPQNGPPKPPIPSRDFPKDCHLFRAIQSQCPHDVDPVLFPFQALRHTSRQRIVFRLRFSSRPCALPGFLRFIFFLFRVGDCFLNEASKPHCEVEGRSIT